jgi:hypothetical protein
MTVSPANHVLPSEPMLRLLARLFGFLALAAGMVAGVLDGARFIADGRLAPMPLGSAGFWLAPRFFPLIEPGVVRHVHPWLWDPLLLNVFLLPTVVVMFVLGTLLLVAGRTKQHAIIAPD